VPNGAMPPVGTTNLKGEIKIYPNPLSDFINVVLDDRGDYVMQIIDITGMIALTYETKEA
jgi:hypothetical protein